MVLEHFAVNERVTGSNPVETEFSDKLNLSELFNIFSFEFVA